MVDKAKDIAVGKVKAAAKEKAIDAVGSHGGVTGKAVDVGADMVSGKSAGEAMMDAGKSGAEGMMKESMSIDKMSTGDAMTAGKVLAKGGSKEEAAMAVAKERAKDAAMKKAKSAVSGVTSGSSYGSGKSAKSYGSGSKSGAEHSDSATTTHSVPTTTTVTTPVNCPTGTTAQADGTCMITGNYQSPNS